MAGLHVAQSIPAVSRDEGVPDFMPELTRRQSGIALDEAPDSFWVSLRYFNFYRLSLAAVFLLAALIFGDSLNLGGHERRLFLVCSGAYLAAAIAFQALLSRWPKLFDWQLSAHVVVDIVALVVLMYASGGIRSGIGVMLLISLAAAALVSGGALMLFYAALASIALLLEQSYWVLIHDAGTANYLQPGLLAIGCFVTAIITNQLAQRVIVNERVARLRGRDLSNQLRINQLVIQDIQDAVLVVDANGLVRQQNRAIANLLGGRAPELDQIESYSPAISEALVRWRDKGGAASVAFRLPESGRQVRARFIAAGLEGEEFTIAFLEDQSRLEQEAQQLKLAALGRLTANIAHEIRNPLSAITHAGELLQEESTSQATGRLVSIIRENALRLDRMVRDVLELSRRDRGQLQTVYLAAFLESFVEQFALSERTDRAIFKVDAPDSIQVKCNVEHLHRIVWNLCRNAWRHGSKRRASVRLTVSQDSGRIELRVADDGPGVPSELEAQLFEPFFTTYSGGTGLGLFIARELCSANGAELAYVGTREGGATFRILWLTNPK